MTEPPDAAADAPVTQDRLLDGRVVLFQPAAGFRAAIDPVLLAAACPVRPEERVLDLGCGTGAASLCVLAREKAAVATGLEIQPGLAALALRSAAASGVAARFTVLTGDVADPPPALGRDAFDQVIANPPYLPAGRSRAGTPAHALAKIEGAADLAVWIGAAHAALRSRGWLTLIHRADRLDALLPALAGRFGAIEILPLWPAPGRPAGRVILRARKGVRSPAALLPGLVLHRADGRATPEAEAILRQGRPLTGA